MSYKTIKPTAEKLKKLADKATPGPWSAEVKATDCIIYPSNEESDEDQTIIFENQFPDNACRHNTRFILACRNFMDGFISDVVKMVDSQRWRDASETSLELPTFDEPVEVLIGGYPCSGRLKEVKNGVLYSKVWISLFTDDIITPTHWRPLQQVGRTLPGFGKSKGKKMKYGLDYYTSER